MPGISEKIRIEKIMGMTTDNLALTTASAVPAALTDFANAKKPPTKVIASNPPNKKVVSDASALESIIK